MVDPSSLPAIRAVLFDLDGTLVDTEAQTDAAIEVVMSARGRPGVELAPDATRGRTWQDIAAQLVGAHGLATSPEALAAELLEVWLSRVDAATPIPGAPAAIQRAARCLSVAVVSSSPRAVIALFLERLGVSAQVSQHACVGAEDVVRSKPDPEGFLRAAARLGVEPGACLVFEDSRAGLEAARAAAMPALAVLWACADPAQAMALAAGSTTSYLTLPETFFEDLARGAGVLGHFR